MKMTMDVRSLAASGEFSVGIFQHLELEQHVVTALLDSVGMG